MKRLTLALAALALSARLTAADPAYQVEYLNGVPRIQLAGNYSQSYYIVWRAAAEQGPYEAITQAGVLCLGSCYADDYGAIPGRTYWYRFDVWSEQGSLSFGPFAVTISAELARRIGARVAPNPGGGATTVTLMLADPPGKATPSEAALFDLQGRRIATLHRGPVAGGTTRIRWDGRGADGAPVPAGVYLLRFHAADGRSILTRVIRAR